MATTTTVPLYAYVPPATLGEYVQQKADETGDSWWLKLALSIVQAAVNAFGKGNGAPSDGFDEGGDSGDGGDGSGE